MNCNDGNDVIMNYNSSYFGFPNIAPYSGNRNISFNLKYKQQDDEYVTEMLKKDFFRESKSPIACPIVFQQKKDDTP